MWIIIIAAACTTYLILTLIMTYMVHQIPRKPVDDAPDWGKVTDTRIPAKDGGSLEVWRVEPEGPSRDIVVLAHGWGRNRGRMVARARIFAELGFTTVIHSARDHGKSSPYRFMNAFRFAEDIEAVLDWLKEPVLLYGHSAGAAGAVIAAARTPKGIKLLFLEGCYAKTRESLLSLYRAYNIFFGLLFAPMVLLWMEFFYDRRLDTVSPANLAPGIDLPVLIIHGERDRNFPLPFARKLRDGFPAGRAELFVAEGSDHSSSSLSPGYPEALRAFVDRHLPRA
ncbi:MAG: alpha/beta fold hydrolase [Pseudomonadota bacterium]